MNDTYDNRSVLVLDQFSNGNAKAQLDTFTQTVNSRSNDQCIDIRSTGTDDHSDQTNEIASDEEPSAAEEIAQAS